MVLLICITCIGTRNNKNQKLGKVPKGCVQCHQLRGCGYSRWVNPIQAKYINNLAAASETAETLLESLQKDKKEDGGGSDQFFQTSAVNFLAACIYFFVNYVRERILYKNFVQVGQDVKEMIKDVQNKKGAK